MMTQNILQPVAHSGNRPDAGSGSQYKRRKIAGAGSSVPTRPSYQSNHTSPEDLPADTKSSDVSIVSANHGGLGKFYRVVEYLLSVENKASLSRDIWDSLPSQPAAGIAAFRNMLSRNAKDENAIFRKTTAPNKQSPSTLLWSLNPSAVENICLEFPGLENELQQVLTSPKQQPSPIIESNDSAESGDQVHKIDNVETPETPQKIAKLGGRTIVIPSPKPETEHRTETPLTMHIDDMRGLEDQSILAQDQCTAAVAGEDGGSMRRLHCADSVYKSDATSNLCIIQHPTARSSNVALNTIDLCQDDDTQIDDQTQKTAESHALNQLRIGHKLDSGTIAFILSMFLQVGFDIREVSLPLRGPRGALKIRHREKQILISLHRPRRDHWVLLHLDSTTRCVNIYDSMKPDDDTHIHDDVKAITTALDSAMDGEVWEMETHSTPQQTNGFDCGVYTLVSALHVMAGYPTPKEINGALWRVLFAVAVRKTGMTDDDIAYLCPAAQFTRPRSLCDRLVAVKSLRRYAARELEITRDASSLLGVLSVRSIENGTTLTGDHKLMKQEITEREDVLEKHELLYKRWETAEDKTIRNLVRDSLKQANRRFEKVAELQRVAVVQKRILEILLEGLRKCEASIGSRVEGLVKEATHLRAEMLKALQAQEEQIARFKRVLQEDDCDESTMAGR